MEILFARSPQCVFSHAARLVSARLCSLSILLPILTFLFHSASLSLSLRHSSYIVDLWKCLMIGDVNIMIHLLLSTRVLSHCRNHFVLLIMACARFRYILVHQCPCREWGNIIVSLCTCSCSRNDSSYYRLDIIPCGKRFHHALLTPSHSDSLDHLSCSRRVCDS